jgi:hypothetical protein
MPRIVMAMSSETTTVPATQSITVFTQDSAVVSQNVAGTKTLLGTVTSTQQTFGPFASESTIYIDTGSLPAIYSVAVSPVLSQLIAERIQRAPTAIDANAGIRIASMAQGIITSNSLLGVTGTLPTGTIVDAMSDFRMDASFDWHVATQGLGGFTIAAASGHTIVGSATIGGNDAGIFRTRKTAANTFVTYRIG